MSQTQETADHGTAAGAQQALNTLALVRTVDRVACSQEPARVLSFARAQRTLCKCKKSDCRVDALYAVWRELLTASGDTDEEQTALARLAYESAARLCQTEAAPVPARTPSAADFVRCTCGHEKYLHEALRCTGTEACRCSGFLSPGLDYQRRRDAADRGQEWNRDSY